MTTEKIVHGQWWIKPCSLYKLSDIEAGTCIKVLRKHVREAIRKEIFGALRKQKEDVTMMGIWGRTRSYVRGCMVIIALFVFSRDNKTMAM